MTVTLKLLRFFTVTYVTCPLKLKLDSSSHFPYHISLDTTISVTLLPSYITDTAIDAAIPLQTRDDEKSSKHAHDCAEHNRQYKSFASDTQGAIGPPSFTSWLKHLYYTVSLARRADGDTGASTQFALDLLLADLLAALVRDDAEMIDRLPVRDRI